MDVFSILESISYWHWIAFGLALLAMELLGTAGYFLWLGVSALIVGVILSLLPIGWQVQWSSFAAFSLLTTWLWWRRQWYNDKKHDQQRNLNQKHKQLIGTTIVLEEDFQAGINRLRIGDSTWSAYTEHAISAGTKVEIIDIDGITLLIEQK